MHRVLGCSPALNKTEPFALLLPWNRGSLGIDANGLFVGMSLLALGGLHLVALSGVCFLNSGINDGPLHMCTYIFFY